MSQDEHLVKVSKQYSAFGSTKLRPSYNMVILGQNTVYAEKLERRYIVGYFIYYVPVNSINTKLLMKFEIKSAVN